MEEDRAEQFAKATQAFPWGFQQSFYAYITHLEQLGFTLEDVKDYHEYRTNIGLTDYQLEMKKKGVIIDCPECPALMFLYDVNVNPENQTGNPDDKTVWVCQNPECMETIYNSQTAEEIIKEREEKE